jgi:large subunit ribosomal protein L9
MGHDVVKAQVRMPSGPIKHVGEQDVSIVLHTDVSIEVRVAVVAAVD